MKKAIVLLFVCAFALTSYAQEEEKAWSVSLDQSFSDKYIWRGIRLNEEGVNQGALDVSYEAGDLGTVGVKVWYNFDLDSENNESGDFSEVDYTLYWERTFDALTLGAGFIYHDFSEVNMGSTQEIFISAAVDMVLNPKLTVFYDLNEVDGFYIDLSIGHSIDLDVLDATLDFGASLGYADDDQASFYYAGAESGFTNYSLSTAVNFPLLENITLTPSVVYYGLLEDADNQNMADDDFVFGVNLNLTF